MALNTFVRMWNLREAFRRVVRREDKVHDDTGALTPDARRFLSRMRSFCYADRSCVIIGPTGYDTHATAVAEGRREVFIELQRVMNVSDEQLFALKDPDEED
jgi:hypothetical protein